jgi:hypothetical protein
MVMKAGETAIRRQSLVTPPEGTVLIKELEARAAVCKIANLVFIPSSAASF